MSVLRNLPVVVGWNRICHPGGVGVGVDDANGRDVVECALVQQDVVLQRVQADDEVWPQHRAGVELFLEARNLLVQMVHYFGPAFTQNLLSVGDAPRDPALEQMVALGQLRGSRYSPVLPIAGAHKQHHTRSPAHLLYHFGGSSQMGGCGFQRDDMDALPDAVDVACVRGVPQRRYVALVGFGCQQELERDVGGRGRVVQERVRLVVGVD
jgi:hypothetical protein